MVRGAGADLCTHGVAYEKGNVSFPVTFCIWDFKGNVAFPVAFIGAYHLGSAGPAQNCAFFKVAHVRSNVSSPDTF